MDRNWMRERLERYLNLCDRIAAQQQAAGGYWDDRCTALNNEANLEIPTVSKIVGLLDPTWTGPMMPPSYASADHERNVRQALGALRDMDEWDVRLAPESPTLLADRMHPSIWLAASAIWGTGEYATAVHASAVALSARIKAKAQSPLNERKLVQQVFSPDPAKADTPRLHFIGDPKDESWQSRQQGLHLLAQGAFAGIRNIAAHETAKWSEHGAMECLAVLSVVARWSDETHLKTHGT